MGFFNNTVKEALLTGKYICSVCGSNMEPEDEWADVLVCQKCGHSIDYERYGFENDEDYDALYPTKEEVMGYDEDEDDSGESYDEVCGELDD